MRISDWSSDVCSSDLLQRLRSIEIVAVIQFDERPAAEVPFAVEPADAITGLVLVEPFVTFRLHALGGIQQHVAPEIGRASCRERVCQYVSISVVAVSLQKKTKNKYLVYKNKNQ